MSLALIALLPQLVAAGVAGVNEVKSIITLFHPGLTDPELNAAVDLIMASAQKHKDLANADIAAAAAQNAAAAAA